MKSKEKSGIIKLCKFKTYTEKVERMNMDQEKRINKADTLAQEVLTLSRNTLLVNLRFLDAALSQFSLRDWQENGIATDGQTVYYNALHVLQSYRAEHAGPARDYLHLVLHCVLRHMFSHKDAELELWDLACDIAVEHAITELGLKAVSVEKERKQQEITGQIKKQTGMLTAEKIYRYLLNNPLTPDVYETWRELFYADEHKIWYGTDILSLSGVEESWKEVSLRLQVDMETFARRQGDKAEAMMQSLREVNRETYDYAGFLYQFASKGEVMRTDPEEFDYIFYTYGMQLYDKMPLIEPVEYKPVKPVRQFVLCVDLAGLISVEQARTFLRKTWEVFQTAQKPGERNELHVLTANGAVVRHEKITSQDEFEAYLSALKIRRTGEADFRPAFLWTDEMVAKRELRNLKGIVYFTDAVGPFPGKKPNYDAVFVFVNDNYSKPSVPAWAIRLVLQKDELNEYEQQ